jgi:membrane-associated phospholipid phosphatase
MPIRARWALAGAAGCTGLLFVTWFAAFHVGFVRNADQSGFLEFLGLRHHGSVQKVTDFFVSLCSPNPYVFLAGAVILIALLRRRLLIAFAAASILLGANVTTQLLKPLLAAPRPSSLVGGYQLLPPASWPSGHTTAAMALGLCLVLVAPARLRPAVAVLAAAFAIAVGYSLMATGNHFPSDILGGLLVAATWTLLVIAALVMDEHVAGVPSASPPRVSIRAALGPAGVVLAAAIVLVLIGVLSRPHDVIDYARTHATLVAVAAAIAALSLALSTGVMLTVRR